MKSTALDIAHSRLGFSSAKRWMGCPGSPREAAKYPKTSSTFAEKGTAAHALAEKCLKHNKPAKAFLNSYVNSYRVDADMARAVQTYLDAVADYQRRYPDATLHIESRADATHLHPDLWGTNDVKLAIPFGPCVIIDYKDGAGVPVEADDPQLVGYAMDPYHHDDASEVVCVVVQPNCPHPQGPIREHTWSRADLAGWAERFKAAAEATDKPDAPLVPGSHCRFCPASGKCPAQHQAALRVACVDFQPVGTQVVAPPAPHTLTPQQKRFVLEQAEVLHAWLKATLAHITNEALAGNPPEGFKMVEGRKGNRKWATNLDEAWLAAQIKDVAAEVEPFETSLRSVADIEKDIGKKVFTVLSKYVEQPPGKPTLVPVEDKRPALTVGPEADFQAVSDDCDF